MNCPTRVPAARPSPSSGVGASQQPARGSGPRPTPGSSGGLASSRGSYVQHRPPSPPGAPRRRLGRPKGPVPNPGARRGSAAWSGARPGGRPGGREGGSPGARERGGEAGSEAGRPGAREPGREGGREPGSPRGRPVGPSGSATWREIKRADSPAVLAGRQSPEPGWGRGAQARVNTSDSHLKSRRRRKKKSVPTPGRRGGSAKSLPRTEGSQAWKRSFNTRSGSCTWPPSVAGAVGCGDWDGATRRLGVLAQGLPFRQGPRTNGNRCWKVPGWSFSS